MIPEIAWYTEPPEFHNVAKCKLFIDIGAHVGHTCKRALELGVPEIIAYEPVEENFVHLKTLPITAIKKAVVTHSGPTLIKVIPETNIGVRQRHPISVPSIEVDSELLFTVLEKKPDGIKVDIEGFEYEPGFLRSLLIAQVPHLWLELHNNPAQNYYLTLFNTVYKRAVIRSNKPNNFECYFTNETRP